MTKLHFVTLSLITLIGSSFISPKENNQSEKKFHVSISQNGKTISDKNGVVKLKDTTFNIVLNFSEPMGILVNASYDKKTFKSAKKNKPLNELVVFTQTGMAERLSNSEREIFIHDQAPSYWYYESDSESRFNETSLTDQGIQCVRTIDNVYEVPTKSTLKVSEVKKDLYLVFISYKRGDKISERLEVQRQYLKLKWKN